MPLARWCALDAGRGDPQARAKMLNVTRGFLFLLIACTLLLGGSAVEARSTRYAAVAYCQLTGLYGYGNGYATKAEAIERAQQECGGRQMVTKWCKNAWIALAVSEARGYGWAWATTAGQARARATENCLEENDDAKVVICVSAFR